MPFNLLLLPLLGGFILISLCNRFKFITIRLDGYRLLLHASVAGTILLILAKVAISLCNLSKWALTTAAIDWWHANVQLRDSGVALLAFVMGATLWWPLNFLFDVDDEANRGARKKEQPLELFLISVVLEPAPILLTLKSGKIYLGIVTSICSPAVALEWIRILPGRSGYRGSIDKKIHFTTNYEEVYEIILSDAGKDHLSLEVRERFELLLPLREVEVVSRFDQDLYDQFFTEQKAIVLHD